MSSADGEDKPLEEGSVPQDLAEGQSREDTTTTAQDTVEKNPTADQTAQEKAAPAEDSDTDPSKIHFQFQLGGEEQRSTEEQRKMDAAFSDSEYRPYNPSEESVSVPPRYQKTTNPDKQAEKQARSQARAEARRTRRTLRLQEQQEQQQHYKLDVEGDSSDESSVDENYDVVSLAESVHETLTWRGRMQTVLHDHWFHIIIVVLVSLDALIVIFELLIDVGAFNNVLCEGPNFIEQAEECHYSNRNRCFPTAGMILENVNISMSPSETGNVTELCKCGFRGGKRVCINRQDALGVNPGEVLHVLSLIILSTFLVEIVLKLVAFRLKYFTHKFEVFDGAVVIISWILDAASIVEEEAFEAASLIIVLRLWRVVRIVNGAILSSKSQTDKDLEEIRSEARKIVHALHKAQDRMDDLETENFLLKRGKGFKK